MNVFSYGETEHDVAQRPVPAFWHHALDLCGPCRRRAAIDDHPLVPGVATVLPDRDRADER